jgi:hypothetical protein
MLPALWLAGLLQAAPLPEGNALVQGLVARHREREEAVSRYTFDVLEVEERLGKNGAVERRNTRSFEVFHVRGRPIRRQVAQDGTPLPAKRQAKLDAEARQKAEAIRSGRVAKEQAGVRISAILDRYDFRSVAREDLDGRPALVLDFAPLPGRRDLERDNVLRRLSGRLWVDEGEGEVVRAEIRNQGSISFGWGLAAKVSSLEVRMEFEKMDDAVWLPRRVELKVAGRKFLFKSFRTRVLASYGNYRRFDVDVDEGPLSPPPPD